MDPNRATAPLPIYQDYDEDPLPIPHQPHTEWEDSDRRDWVDKVNATRRYWLNWLSEKINDEIDAYGELCPWRKDELYSKCRKKFEEDFGKIII